MSKSTTPDGAVSSIDYQQRRGMLADAVDWAIIEYDGYMMDDEYDAQKVLDRIINRLREVRDMLNEGKK